MMHYRLKNSLPVFLLITGLLAVHSVQAAKAGFAFTSEGMNLKVEQVAEGFAILWGLAFINENKILVTERSGSVYSFDLATKSKIKLSNVPAILLEGQGGMLDVAVPPGYKPGDWVYFTYVKEVDDEGVTVLARAKLKSNRFEPWQELLVSDSATDTGYHFGSRIAFDNAGHVYFGIGDRGERPNSQDLSNHAGSIIRLKRDGSIPADNPFINSKNVLPEIWSYGHRNPQGLAFDSQYNRLWEIEHGPRGGDEINLVEPAKNYGWPVISYGKEYWGPIAVGEGTHKEGMEQPVKVYVPSIAPGSLVIYKGDVFPKWKGNLFSGALKLRHINRVVIDRHGKAIKEERLLESMDQRIRAISQSPQGWLYFTTDSGKIYRIIPHR